MANSKLEKYNPDTGEWEHIGPLYPDLGATVAKFRRKANACGSVMELDKAERRAYAEAIEKTIRAKHRTLHMKPTPPMTPDWYNPPSITRLLKYDKPIKMVGDPNWIPKCSCRLYGKCDCDHWGAREQSVYQAMMESKRA